MIEIAPGLFIDELDLQERFVRASGPGGQNVNKLSSAVELRFNLAGCRPCRRTCWRGWRRSPDGA